MFTQDPALTSLQYSKNTYYARTEIKHISKSTVLITVKMEFNFAKEK